MEDYIFMLLGAISLISLTSLALVIYLLYKGNSSLLYKLPYSQLRSRWHLVLVIIAVITLLVIFYHGTLYITSWMSELFGFDGYRASQAFSSPYALFFGLMFIHFISENMIWKTEAEFSSEKIRLLEDTVDALIHRERKGLIEKQLEGKIKALSSEKHEEDPLAISSSPNTINARRLNFYRELLAKMSRADTST